MKVLQLCIKPPYPTVDGGTMAMNGITQGLLSAGCEVKVLSVCSDKHPVRPEAMGEEYQASTHFESVYLDLRVRPVDAAVALLCGESYHVKRFVSSSFEQKLIQLLEQDTYDVVHMESIFLASYLPAIRNHSDAKVVLRAHNVEHHIWRQAARQTRNPFKRWYLKQLSLTLGAFEREHLNAFDGVVSITRRDAETLQQMGCRRPIVAIPFGVTLSPLPDSQAVEPFTLYHLGAMDWMPNQESVRWFLQKVWPQLHQQLPQVRLYLAGRRMPADLMQLQMEGVTVTGEVPDAAQFVKPMQINIVPLHSGSGLRIKIIEALSMGKVVISTHAGAEGIDYQTDDNLLIADTPEEFVRQISRCVRDQDYCRRVGNCARRLVAEVYDNDKLTQRLLRFYDTLQGGGRAKKCNVEQ